MGQNQHYPFSHEYFNQYLKRLNSKNISIQHMTILEEGIPQQNKKSKHKYKRNKEKNKTIMGKDVWLYQLFGEDFDVEDMEDLEDFEKYDKYDIPPVITVPPHESFESKRMRIRNSPGYYPHLESKTGKNKKSENFEIVTQTNTRFKDIGGYESVKLELLQCVDILSNLSKYKPYHVRTPKGLILEGPPGNGKTLLAKGFAGEANVSFIAVAGSEFQEKYVGVGSSRVKELFQLAKENTPCVIFIDEIDAVGRKRSGESESSGSERDNTLNQLLIQMDGFQCTDGIFIIGATNRVDLLDPALIRPGRIDKRIFIGLPDSVTREAIIRIHIHGKPCDETVDISNLVDLTSGMSASQIENMLNEAMLLAIRNHVSEQMIRFTQLDIEVVLNRIMAGWQPTDHQFTNDMLERITVHEMGHALVGLLMKQHSKLSKIVINLSSPNMPGYTIFEGSTTSLYTRDSLFEHLMILLAGRIAEEVFYNVSVTTGAINDFEEALKLAQKMVVYYGMGKKLIYPSSSEKFKEQIDNEVLLIIQDAYTVSQFIIRNCKEVIRECALILQKEKILKRDDLLKLIQSKYPDVMSLYCPN
jgi:cell division protease FtsH